MSTDRDTIQAIQNFPEYTGSKSLDELVATAGKARVVLIGEASHGTSEYYSTRAELTKRLVAEKGFTCIGVEGDWPPCYEMNRYIKGFAHQNKRAQDVQAEFHRWPTWMWANEEVADFMEWAREYNAARPLPQRVGFYGLDVYSLWESLEALTTYLRRVDPEAVESAMEAYRCFEPFRDREELYASLPQLSPARCENEAVLLLADIRARMPSFPDNEEARLNAEQNARVVVDAERYYTQMLRGGGTSWNVRDRHMMETMNQLLAYFNHESGGNAKLIVWAHNTHIGDARATDMASAGMINIGQLAREAWPNDTCLVGFGSASGSVIAGRRWGAPYQEMNLPEARPGSWESLFHAAGARDRVVLTANSPVFNHTRRHRAVGVVYNPNFEYGNYVPTNLAHRYDAFIYLDQTRALQPLEVPADLSEVPDTYPKGV